MPGTPRPDPVSTKRQRIAELARDGPEMAFTTLAHHIDIEWLRTAHGQTRKDGAVGVDGQTAAEYEADLEANLQDLLHRAKSWTSIVENSSIRSTMAISGSSSSDGCAMV